MNDNQLAALLQDQDIKNVIGQLKLTPAEQQQANILAIDLFNNSNLYNCDNKTKLMYCLKVATYDFKKPNCVYPVPYKNEIQVQLSYLGLKDLAFRTKQYRDINAVAVYSCDKIKRDRLLGTTYVEFAERTTENDTLIGYYAYAIDNSKSIVASVYMSIDQLNAHANKYSVAHIKGSQYDFWKSNFDDMCKKTLIKKLVKQLDFNDDKITNAIALDQAVIDSQGNATYKDNPQNNLQSDDDTIDTTIIQEPQIKTFDEYLADIASANTLSELNDLLFVFTNTNNIDNLRELKHRLLVKATTLHYVYDKENNNFKEEVK